MTPRLIPSSFLFYPTVIIIVWNVLLGSKLSVKMWVFAAVFTVLVVGELERCVSLIIPGTSSGNRWDSVQMLQAYCCLDWFNNPVFCAVYFVCLSTDDYFRFQYLPFSWNHENSKAFCCPNQGNCLSINFPTSGTSFQYQSFSGIKCLLLICVLCMMPQCNVT